MVMGSRSGSQGTGSVSRTWRREGVTGRSTPTSSPTRRDQAPAAQTSAGVSTIPLEVTTAAMASPAEVDLVAGAAAEGGERLQAAGAEQDVEGVGELRPHPAGGLAGGAGGQLVALDQHHLADAGLGQVEGDAGAHHAAADHDHVGP